MEKLVNQKSIQTSPVQLQPCMAMEMHGQHLSQVVTMELLGNQTPVDTKKSSPLAPRLKSMETARSMQKLRTPSPQLQTHLTVIPPQQAKHQVVMAQTKPSGLISLSPTFKALESLMVLLTILK